MSWNDRWMQVADLVSTWSKDRSRQTGAVIVDDRNVLVSIGWNGFPRGVNDDVDARHERPVKYKFTVHAETNSLFNAAANGISTFGCTMFLSWYPCSDCAKGIVQSGIKRLVCLEPDWADAIWAEDFSITKTMLSEGGVEVVFVGQYGEQPR